MLSRAFIYFNEKMVKTIYTTFVRPHLEFGIPAWSPYLKGDQKEQEKVKERATKLAPEIRGLNYERRLSKLGLTTLNERRKRGDSIQQYKIFKGFDRIN